jgi:hypothetical protein
MVILLALLFVFEEPVSVGVIPCPFPVGETVREDQPRELVIPQKRPLRQGQQAKNPLVPGPRLVIKEKNGNPAPGIVKLMRIVPCR